MAVPSYAQNLGRISGIVTDTSGGIISGAAVTVTDTERSITRNLTADTTGTYSAPNLIPSTYVVKASYMGFSPTERTGISVGVGDDVHIDLTLQPGQQTQAITVTGEAPQITTTNAQLGGEVTGQTLTELPIAGHNFLQMLALRPGMQGRPGGGAAGQQPYSNGLRAEYNVFLFDGVASYTSYYPTSQPIAIGYAGGGPEQAVVVPPDSVQDFNVVENPKAEYGWRPGAQVSVGMKSGTNTLHGTAFALGRDTALMARNSFFPTKTSTQFENYGATFGGPIHKDKMFYLVGYEGQNESVGNPKTVVVPTTASLAGTPRGASATASFPDAINALIAKNTINPLSLTPAQQISLNLAGCVVEPAVQCTANQGLFANNTLSTSFPINIPLTGGTNDGVAKVDYHLNEHNSMNAEFFGGRGAVAAPVGNVVQPYWAGPLETISYVSRAVWTWIPNSAWVNDARFGWDHSYAANGGSYDCDPRSGAPAVDTNFSSQSGAQVCGVPGIAIGGFNNAPTNFVIGGQGASSAVSNIYRWLDSISYTHGNHIFKFGGEYALNTGTVSLNIQNSKGTITFNSNNPGVVVPGFGTGTAAATPLEYFLDGLPSAATLQVGTLPRSFRFNQFAGYAQDDWRIFPRLTLNLGLRYEYMSTIRATDSFFANFDPSSPSGLRQQGNGGPMYSFDPWAFAPRFGFAWDMTGKSTTVLRGGFNIVYQQPTGQVFFSPAATLNVNPSGLVMRSGCTLAGFTAAAIATCTNAVTTPGGTINLANLAINPPTAPITWAPNALIFGNYVSATPTCTNQSPCAVGGAATHITFPMVLQWNFGIQRSLTRNLALDVNYVGNHGQHLFAYTDINQPGVGTSGALNEQLRRPYFVNGQFPWFGKIGMLGSFGERSNYEALQAVLTSRGIHGLSFTAGYTYAHANDQGSVDMGMVIPMNSLNPGLEYGNSATDLRHRFTFSPSYFLPSRKSPLQMLQGWQLTSAFTITSGRPYNPIDATDDFSGTGEGQDRWSLVGNPRDFDSYGAQKPIPCFAAPGSSFASLPGLCAVGVTTPQFQACLNAAAAEPLGPSGTTGTASVMKAGCYVVGSSVMIPPAQGTFGNMSRYELFGPGFEEWDLSIIKAWRIKERLTAQFRAEIYNVINATEFATPSLALNQPQSFGQSQSTPEIGANSPIIGTGGPRKIQLGLKFSF